MTVVTPPKPTYNQCAAATAALLELAKIGTKEGGVLRRLTRMIRYCRVAEEKLETALEVLMLGHAAKVGDEIEAVEVQTKDGQRGQRPAIKNQVEYARQEAAIRRTSVDTDETAPRAFTWEELTTKFKSEPPANVIEALGPFGTIPAEDE
jgi:hypothetical protein